MENIKELKPVFSKQKSFYSKAEVKEDEKGLSLYSYKTKIATIKNNELIFLTIEEEHYTNTTIKHLKEFCLQNNIKYLGKQKMIKIAWELNNKKD